MDVVLFNDTLTSFHPGRSGSKRVLPRMPWMHLSELFGRCRTRQVVQVVWTYKHGMEDMLVTLDVPKNVVSDSARLRVL